MSRAYLRLDPGFDEHKESYPDGPYAALVCVLCLAESQPQRGRFRSERFLRALMGKRARHLTYLLEHDDLVPLPDGRLYVDGWDEWQEGDWKVGERLERVRIRRERNGQRRNGSGPRSTKDNVAGATGTTVRSATVGATPLRLDSGAVGGALHSGGADAPPSRGATATSKEVAPGEGYETFRQSGAALGLVKP